MHTFLFYFSVLDSGRDPPRSVHNLLSQPGKHRQRSHHWDIWISSDTTALLLPGIKYGLWAALGKHIRSVRTQRCCSAVCVAQLVYSRWRALGTVNRKQTPWERIQTQSQDLLKAVWNSVLFRRSWYSLTPRCRKMFRIPGTKAKLMASHCKMSSMHKHWPCFSFMPLVLVKIQWWNVLQHSGYHPPVTTYYLNC